MNYLGVEICCPRCHGDLVWTDQDQEVLRCAQCPADYRMQSGIPDLRVHSDPYLSNGQDIEKAAALAARAPDRSLSELIDYYHGQLSVVPPAHAELYRRGMLMAPAKARVALEAWRIPNTHRLLDVGCGTGPLLVAAGERVGPTVGVDIGLRWLQLARKRLHEAGRSAPLICASAEALPFPPGSFDAVNCDATFEVLRDQQIGLTEISRVLAPGGAVCLGTANRYSLGPDPHTGALTGSWWPDRLVAWYMTRRNAIPPKRRFHSAGGMRRLLIRAGFRDVSVYPPPFPIDQLGPVPFPLRMAVRMYEGVRSVPGGAAVLRTFGPRLLVRGRR